MAFMKPIINQIKADIQSVFIYLRTTKKFGKTTLFRDTVIAKYGDPTYGLLVQCGKERGATMLDNVNTLPSPMQTFKDFKELKDWLINHKDEHHIKMIAFDTVDELIPIFEKETIRLSKIENPDKPCRTINAAFGGFQAGQRYTANELIKPYMDELREAGFCVWAISHTKFKTIKEKGGTDENGYQQLTSNLEASYESAFGDIFDICLTGTIDRATEEKKIKQGDKVVTKHYAVGDPIRKLYFRETPLIDAGGRFALGSVPDYMIFDKGNMAEDFIRVIEEGLEKSKTCGVSVTKENVKPAAPVVHEIEEEEEIDAPWEETEEDEIEDVVDETEDLFDDEQIEELKNQLRNLFKDATKEDKRNIKDIIGTSKFADIKDIEKLKQAIAYFD